MTDDRRLKYILEAHAERLSNEQGKPVTVEDIESEKGFDPNWLRNAVFEPLEEADLIKDKKKD